MFCYGIEHEVAFTHKNGDFADFTNTSSEEFNAIIALLPYDEKETEKLYKNTHHIKYKKWYIEGMERFDEEKKFIRIIPKGIEIRTGIHHTIQDTIQELSQNYDLLCEKAKLFDFTPFQTSFNPQQTEFIIDIPMNVYEKEIYKYEYEREIPHIYMLTYGPDLNLSIPNWSVEKMWDLAQKFIYYSPFIIPFSYSPCLYEGKTWGGKSIRTFMRNGGRFAVRFFVEKSITKEVVNPNPIKIARTPHEIGRIEFKTFDSCADFTTYSALFALLKGIALDDTLLGRAVLPSIHWHKTSGLYGFENLAIYSGAKVVLQAAKKALIHHEEANLLNLLEL